MQGLMRMLSSLTAELDEVTRALAASVAMDKVRRHVLHVSCFVRGPCAHDSLHSLRAQSFGH